MTMAWPPCWYTVTTEANGAPTNDNDVKYILSTFTNFDFLHWVTTLNLRPTQFETLLYSYGMEMTGIDVFITEYLKICKTVQLRP